MKMMAAVKVWYNDYYKEDGECSLLEEEIDNVTAIKLSIGSGRWVRLKVIDSGIDISLSSGFLIETAHMIAKTKS